MLSCNHSTNIQLIFRWWKDKIHFESSKSLLKNEKKSLRGQWFIPLNLEGLDIPITSITLWLPFLVLFLGNHSKIILALMAKKINQNLGTLFFYFLTICEFRKKVPFRHMIIQLTPTNPQLWNFSWLYKNWCLNRKFNLILRKDCTSRKIYSV